MPPTSPSAMRSKAKMVSYGLAYGMESYGLAQRLGIPVDEAAAILKAYFEGFPNVRAYMDRVVAEARDRGYTETLFGRRRLIPELQSSRYQVRAAGERQAMNAGIQGLAADIFKVALVRLDARLDAGVVAVGAVRVGAASQRAGAGTDRGLASRLVLQVHDEVILEVPPDEEEAAVEVVTAAMTGAADLRVPADHQPGVGRHLGRRQGVGHDRRLRTAPGRARVRSGSWTAADRRCSSRPGIPSIVSGSGPSVAATRAMDRTLVAPGPLCLRALPPGAR